MTKERETTQTTSSNPNQATESNQQGLTTAQSGQGQRSQQTGIARRDQSPLSVFGGSPFTFMRRFSEQMDRLFEDFFGRSSLIPSFEHDLFPSSFGNLDTFWPQVEVFERNDQLVVRADLPGLTKDDVHVEIKDNALTISGERRSEQTETHEGYRHSERSYGKFYRQIPLPKGINAENATATFNNGVLEITMQAPERQPRGHRIEISDTAQSGTQHSGEPQARAQAAASSR